MAGNIDYKPLDYSNYDHSIEFDSFFLDKKAISEVPITGINYVFFTSPELSLTMSKFGNGQGHYYSPKAVVDNTQRVLKLPGSGVSIYNDNIVRSLSGEKGNFLYLLSNRAASLPASAVQLSTVDYGETWNRYKMVLGTTSKDTKISGVFELVLREDSDLTVTKFHKLWMEYIEALFKGRIISAYSNSVQINHTQSAVIDYLSSVYTFSLKPDGRTIQHWSKYTGVFPVKIPYDVFQSEDGDMGNQPKLHFEYQFAYKEDMDPQILRDFNLVASATNASRLTQHADANSAFNDEMGVAESDLPLNITHSPGVRRTTDGRFELLLSNSKDKYGYNSNVPTPTTPASRSNGRNIPL